MVGDEGGANGGAGPGWDAAEKFFGGGGPKGD
jgi:hypothetical protein